MNLEGIGKLSRQRLSSVLRHAKGYITASLVSECLKVSPKKAQSFLAAWAKRGWLSRIRKGIYLSLDITAESSDEVLVDPWKIAAELFKPCYVSGWSAAEYWGLTEQIFQTTIILTTKPVSKKLYHLGKTRFLLKKISNNQLFGMKVVWKDQLKVQVADCHKTIIDMLDDPSLGGGIASVIDFLKVYLSSTECNLQTILDYAKKMKNKTIFKRLGFLISLIAPDKKDIIEHCLQNMSKGNSRLDPDLESPRLLKKWRLWIPQSFINISRK